MKVAKNRKAGFFRPLCMRLNGIFWYLIVRELLRLNFASMDMAHLERHAWNLLGYIVWILYVGQQTLYNLCGRILVLQFAGFWVGLGIGNVNYYDRVGIQRTPDSWQLRRYKIIARTDSSGVILTRIVASELLNTHLEIAKLVSAPSNNSFPTSWTRDSTFPIQELSITFHR